MLTIIHSKIGKILIVLITMIILFNFIMPNYIYAATTLEKIVMNGLSVLVYLVGKAGDLCMCILQKSMVGIWELKDNGEYAIRYSPGLIFANKIPMLNANFLQTNEEITIRTSNEIDWNDRAEVYRTYIKGKEWGEIEDRRDYKASETKYKTSEGWKYYCDICKEWAETEAKAITSSLAFAMYTNNGTDDWKWVDNFAGEDNYLRDSNIDQLVSYIPPHVWTGYRAAVLWFEKNDINNVTLRVKVFFVGASGESYTDERVYNCSDDPVQLGYTSTLLRPTIAKWYYALRTIALVGMLSVLIYVGIQIILSSGSAQKQAKYKSMLVDWLVAICILFTLHYMMAFMLSISEKLIDIMDNKVSSDINGSDELMSTVRQNMKDNFWLTSSDPDAKENEEEKVNDQPAAGMGHSIMWLAMVILTFAFTFQYIKRLIYMAFLTMMAPMVALTYPLDKIKDGKAQAFSYWLKEYIFNCLIQPVHLLLYIVLIDGVALEFAKNNVLYAILALTFLVPAEKIIKEMFGLRSSGPSGQVNAAATAAIATNAINKLSRKKGNKDEEKSNGVRTKSNVSGGSQEGQENTAPLEERRSRRRDTLSGGSAAQRTPSEGEDLPKGGAEAGEDSTGEDSSNGGVLPRGASSGGSPAQRDYSEGGDSSSGDPVRTGGASRQSPETTESTSSNRPTSTYKKPGFKGGVTAIGKRYVWGDDIRRKRRKGLGRLALKAPFAVAAGALGVAANVADGELYTDTKKAFGEIAGASVAGYAIGGRIVGKGKEVIGTYKEGAYGKEEYNNMKFDKEFYQSDGYKMIEQDADVQEMCEDWGMSVKEVTQTYLDEGITDSEKIRKAIKAGISAEEYDMYTTEGIDKIDVMSEIKTANLDVRTYKAFRDHGLKDVKEIKKLNSYGITDIDVYENFKKAGYRSADRIIEEINKARSADPNVSVNVIADRLNVVNGLRKNEGIETATEVCKYLRDKKNKSENDIIMTVGRLFPDEGPKTAIDFLTKECGKTEKDAIAAVSKQFPQNGKKIAMDYLIEKSGKTDKDAIEKAMKTADSYVPAKNQKEYISYLIKYRNFTEEDATKMVKEALPTLAEK